MRTVGSLLRWRANQHPDQAAIVHGDRRLSFAQLDRAANRVANALRESGLRPGDHVCVLDKGHDRFFEVMFGIAKAGGVFTPVNWRLAAPEIAYVINDAEATVLIVGGEFADAVRSIEPELAKVRQIVRFDEGPENWAPYEAWRDAASDVDPVADTRESETTWQLYTSGTTGHPKGAEITPDNLFSLMSVASLGFGTTAPGGSGLVSVPLYHIGGTGYALFLLYSGVTVVVTREFEPGAVLETIEQHRIQHAFLVPAMLNFLLLHPNSAKTDFSSLETILYGASPIPEELLVQAMERFGCGFVQAYGLTETSGAIVTLAAEDHVVGSPKLRAAGKAVFGCDIRILDGEGNECAPGNVGEIVVRCDSVMKGYWNLPEASAQSIRGGWFYTGDAGYLDEDAYLYIHDRVKDMIVSGGENVYPAEVESVLYAHPEIADVAVIGVPDERWGESVKAVVVRAPGSTLTQAQVIEFAKDQIAGYKRPKSVDFVDELPRNPTGKILKRELREAYWKGHERRVH